jgi:hypothetical protein
MFRKPHFQPPASGGAARRGRHRRRLPPSGAARGRQRAGGKGLPCLSRRGGRQGEGVGKPRHGKGRHGAREAAGRRQRPRKDHKRRADGKGGRGGKRPSFGQAGRHGAERGKGKGGRQSGLSGAARGLCGTVARGSTREKKSPARGGACKGCAAAGFHAGGGGGGVLSKAECLSKNRASRFTSSSHKRRNSRRAIHPGLSCPAGSVRPAASVRQTSARAAA